MGVCCRWKLISIEFSAEEREREKHCVLQHITFNGNTFYLADFSRPTVVEEMDQIYCLCDIFISIVYDHVTWEKKIGGTRAFEILSTD